MSDPDEDEEPGPDDLVALDGPTMLDDPDVVPTADTGPDVRPTYRDWDPANTKLISCRIANDWARWGERFESREEARAAVTLRHGRILEANYVPGRAIFRVARVREPRKL